MVYYANTAFNKFLSESVNLEPGDTREAREAREDRQKIKV